MATAAVQLDEEALIREKIAELKLPAGVKFKRLELGSEWTGEPAWHIYFSISTGRPLTRSRIAAFVQVEQMLRENILALRLGKYPFVHLLEAR